MSAPLVDIAIVTYNHEKFISQTLESVLMQKTDFAYRVIIGDDCSTDKTQEIIQAYAQKYPDKFKTILLSEHLGLQAKNRVGIQVLRLCTAPYLALLDGDDYWSDPLKLQKQVDFLQGRPDFMMCSHWVKWVDDTTGEVLIDSFGPPVIKPYYTIDDLFEYDNFTQTCSVLYRNSRLGIMLDRFYETMVNDFILNCIHVSEGKIGFLGDTMAVYRRHQGGVNTGNSYRNNVGYLLKTYSLAARELHLERLPSYRRSMARWYLNLCKLESGEGRKTKALVAGFKAIGIAPAGSRIKTINSVLFLISPRLHQLPARLMRMASFIKNEGAIAFLKKIYSRIIGPLL